MAIPEGQPGGPKEAEKVGNPLPDYDTNDPMWAPKEPYRPYYPPAPPAAEDEGKEGGAAAEAEGEQ